MSQFVVAHRGAVKAPGRSTKIFVPNETIPDGVFSADQLQALAKQGWIKRRGGQIESDLVSGQAAPTTLPLRGMDAPDLLPESQDKEAQEAKRRASGKKIQQRISIWDADPDRISGLDLDQLNVLVQERDPSMEAFETREEAIAQLSQDFRG